MNKRGGGRTDVPRRMEALQIPPSPASDGSGRAPSRFRLPLQVSLSGPPARSVPFPRAFFSSRSSSAGDPPYVQMPRHAGGEGPSVFSEIPTPDIFFFPTIRTSPGAPLPPVFGMPGVSRLIQIAIMLRACDCTSNSTKWKAANTHTRSPHTESRLDWRAKK